MVETEIIGLQNLKANINFVLCVRELLYCEEKMLSSSVVCLSFTILNTFERKVLLKF